MTANRALDWIDRKLRLRVPSSLRSSAAAYLNPQPRCTDAGAVRNLAWDHVHACKALWVLNAVCLGAVRTGLVDMPGGVSTCSARAGFVLKRTVLTLTLYVV